MHAVAEAARNVACSGARPIAATNCLNFGSPEKPEVMWQFSEVIDGLAAACNELETPITGGNVSFYNETLGASIFPTPVIGILGVLEDAANVLKMGFRNAGDIIVLLDGRAATDSIVTAATASAHLSTARREFSSSEYSKTIAGIVAGQPPAIDLAAEKRLQHCLVTLASSRALQSAHDVSDGGLAVTLAESCFAGGTGAWMTLKQNDPAEEFFFGERGARAVISITASSLDGLLNSARECGVFVEVIGHVTSDGIFSIQYHGSAIIEESVEKLRDIWGHSLERALKQ
jgi:phosphoribosylformylglycinamidine synthase